MEDKQKRDDKVALNRGSNGLSLPVQPKDELLDFTEKGQAVDVEDIEGNAREYQCGLWSWRPSVLQPFANIKSFTFVLCMIHGFGNINFTYYTAVITQIEKQFGLSSFVSGFIKNVDNVGYVIAVILVSHFLRFSNKSIIFCVATAGSAFAIALFAMPHFLYGATDMELLPSNLTSATKNHSNFDICHPEAVDESAEICTSKIVLLPMHVGAIVFFVLSEILQGVFQSPKFVLSLTHMDDNAKKDSPLYFGFMFAVRSFSPVLGFMLGAWAVGMYVDLSDPGLSRRDPRWIGAWWIGFLICGAATLVWAFPIALFPSKFAGDQTKKSSEQKKLTENKEKEPDEEKVEVAPPKTQLKDLPRAVFRIATNPIVLFMITASCFNFYLMGFSTFTPKYLENHFRMSGSQASLLTGVVSACSYSLGPIVSGKIMSGRQITTSAAIKFILVVNLIAAVGFTIMGFLKCPTTEWTGEITIEGPTANSTCNQNCNCDPYMFTPVCGSDGQNYFSPCFAGCTQSSPPSSEGGEMTFTNCTCTGGEGWATEGQCDKSCTHVLVPYIIIMIISKFSASMTIVPYLTVLMRSVSYKDKAMSLAFSVTIMQIAAFPAPAVFGFVIDSTCIFKQSSCSSKGACLLYDVDKFRVRLHTFAALIKICASCMYGLALIYVNWMDRKEKKKNKEQEEEIKDNGTKNIRDGEKEGGATDDKASGSEEDQDLEKDEEALPEEKALLTKLDRDRESVA